MTLLELFIRLGWFVFWKRRFKRLWVGRKCSPWLARSQLGSRTNWQQVTLHLWHPRTWVGWGQRWPVSWQLSVDVTVNCGGDHDTGCVCLRIIGDDDGRQGSDPGDFFILHWIETANPGGLIRSGCLIRLVVLKQDFLGWWSNVFTIQNLVLHNNLHMVCILGDWDWSCRPPWIDRY